MSQIRNFHPESARKPRLDTLELFKAWSILEILQVFQPAATAEREHGSAAGVRQGPLRRPHHVEVVEHDASHGHASDARVDIGSADAQAITLAPGIKVFRV